MFYCHSKLNTGLPRRFAARNDNSITVVASEAGQPNPDNKKALNTLDCHVTTFLAMTTGLPRRYASRNDNSITVVASEAWQPI
jgi:hypothetical protein